MAPDPRLLSGRSATDAPCSAIIHIPGGWQLLSTVFLSCLYRSIPKADLLSMFRSGSAAVKRGSSFAGAALRARNQTPRLATLRQFSTSFQMAQQTRAESDAFGEIPVAADRYWGAQTERSLSNFKINQPHDRMPPQVVRAFGILKGAAATVNMKFGLGMP
jgi:hypothetical protein